MQIGALAKASGVNIETIRYYEKSGLLPAPRRSTNGYRQYSPQHLQRLIFIRHCRALDISLADIQQLLALLAHPEADCTEVDQLIEAHLIQVRQRLQNLQGLEQQLMQLRQGCHDRQCVRDCGIVHALLDHGAVSVEDD